MKLYTSYWAQVRNFPPNLVILNTTVWPPKWYKIGGIDKRGVISLHCPPLRPNHSCDGLCNGKCNPKHPHDCQFLKVYQQQLESIDFKLFMQQLTNLRNKLLKDFPNQSDFNFAFVFFEKYDNPCSERWPVQQWIRNHGLEIEEWKE
jgi:hypothetical protein